MMRSRKISNIDLQTIRSLFLYDYDDDDNEEEVTGSTAD